MALDQPFGCSRVFTHSFCLHLNSKLEVTVWPKSSFLHPTQVEVSHIHISGPKLETVITGNLRWK